MRIASLDLKCNKFKCLIFTYFTIVTHNQTGNTLQKIIKRYIYVAKIVPLADKLLTNIPSGVPFTQNSRSTPATG
jgi:hypothetical protein